MEISILVTVEFDTPFNVGSGASSDTWANKPMVKDRDGLPLIPASSVKGRLRHQCEQLAVALGWEPAPCGSPMAEAMCQPDPRKGDIFKQLCPACRLFGSPWYPGPLAFSDLRLIEPAYLRDRNNRARTTVRHGVGISRQRRVAEDQLLYTVEVFQPGSLLTLAGNIRGRVASEEDLELLVAGLDSLLTLGSGKTRGMGWCRLRLSAKEFADGAEQPIDLDSIRRRWESGTHSA